jgi:hypothetical protein
MDEAITHVDLRNSSFDDFVNFLFDRDVSSESEGRDYWYWHMAVEFDAKKIGEYYVQLFRQPDFLLKRFTTVQLEEGFWAIQGPNLDCSVFRIIADRDLPLPAGKNASFRWLICLADFSQHSRSIAPFRCGGTHCAMTGTVGIENANVVARIWNCRIFFFKRSPGCLQ